MQVAGIDVIQVAEVAVALVVTYLIARVASKSLAKIFEKTPFPEEIEKWIVKLSRYVIYVAGIFAAISISGFDLTSVIVGLGALSIAISFATSNVIQNFVSGLLVQADRIFKAGDEIKVQTYEGKVVKVSVRTTVIENKDGDMVFIPNSIFIANPVIKKKRGQGNSFLHESSRPSEE